MKERTVSAEEPKPRSKSLVISVAQAWQWPLMACLALSACSKLDDLDGFKDVKFGLSAQGVEDLGFACDGKGVCESNAANLATTSGQPLAALLASADRGRGVS